MNEKYKNWLKKFGIAGFLFFLIKGILWLLLGSAFYRWLKNFFIISMSTIFPFALEAQIKDNTRTIIQINNSILNNYELNWKEINPKPFFCKLEDRLNPKKRSAFKLRLGTVEYADKLEYSKYLIRNEKIFFNSN
jgi:hypothetical protein